MSDDWPLGTVPSCMTPQERRAFWEEVKASNIERMFRPQNVARLLEGLE